MAKVVQISCYANSVTQYLYALCDDGSIWQRNEGQWTEVESPVKTAVAVPSEFAGVKPGGMASRPY